jgi:hypothetical protein
MKNRLDMHVLDRFLYIYIYKGIGRFIYSEYMNIFICMYIIIGRVDRLDVVMLSIYFYFIGLSLELAQHKYMQNYDRGVPSHALYVKNIAPTVDDSDLRFVFGCVFSSDEAMQ